MNIIEGNVAPDFQLPDETGKIQSLKGYTGKYILLYFYPKDDTPGCTVEAQCMRDRMNDLKSAGVQVLGVSADDEKSHLKFKEKHHLNFPLLADVNKKVIQEYGVWKEKSMYGKKYMGISRESFLIGPDGKIIKHYEKVKPEKHAEEVLEDVGTLRGKG
jgi:peroxiredoxin Q/BCP